MRSPPPMESSMMRAATDTMTMITTGFCSLDANATGPNKHKDHYALVTTVRNLADQREKEHRSSCHLFWFWLGLLTETTNAGALVSSFCWQKLKEQDSPEWVSIVAQWSALLPYRKKVPSFGPGILSVGSLHALLVFVEVFTVQKHAGLGAFRSRRTFRRDLRSERDLPGKINVKKVN